jgi:hypothetical protein
MLEVRQLDHLPGTASKACITCYGKINLCQRKKPLHTAQKEKKNFLTITVPSDDSSPGMRRRAEKHRRNNNNNPT